MVNWEVSCVEKKAISIIALDPRAARSYGRDVEGLFGEVADVSVFSVMDGSAMGVLPHADLFAASTDAFGSPEELARRILTLSADHGGLSDDCAVLALYRPRAEASGRSQV